MIELLLSEEEKKSNELFKSSLELFKSSNVNYSEPENFHSFLVYKLKKALKLLVNSIHEDKIQNVKYKEKLYFIYTNYDFLEHNIEELCVLREGHGCSADKSRSILNMYLNYCISGEIPKFNPDIEKYYMPNFGTYVQWIELCESLYSLYYGKTKKYFEAYNTLIQCKKRKYKHILHMWYIKFKDGTDLEIANSWDNNIENPLDNKFNDKGDFYIVYDRTKGLLENKNYEIYEEDEISLPFNKFYKIPKSDIEKIYKTSTEHWQ